jgi:hypothetical protein
MAHELWEEVHKDFAKFYPNATAPFRKLFEELGDTSKTPDQLRSIIQKSIDELQAT